ncbi:MAG: PKD repeat protein [Flavobacteriales bacterium]|jgi:PKD repeat protein
MFPKFEDFIALAIHRFRWSILVCVFLCCGAGAQMAQAQIEPDDLPGLQLWLRSDTGLTVSETGKIGVWEDISGQLNHATQVSGSLKPNFVEDVLFGFPSVRMDGFNDFMVFPEINTIRTVFWLVKEDADANANFRSLFGHSNSIDFIRGAGEEIWNTESGNTYILNGITQANFSVVDGGTTVLPNDFTLISLVTSGDVKANQLTVDRSNFSRIWDGDMIEIICFSDSLSEENVEAVQNYLADRYTPPFFVDEDVQMDYGFCDTLICCAPDFESYLWSNGEDDQCINVHTSDDFIVEATDRFNRIHTDTIQVSFPGDLQFEDMIVCLGESTTFDTGLANADYTFQWQNNEIDSALTVSEAGQYFVQITDTTGCSSVSDVSFVVVDSIEVNLNLEENYNLCAGNTLVIETLDYTIDSFEWSSGEVESEIEVNVEGEFWIHLIDEFGCIFKDTTQVNIIGTAPEIEWNIDGQCQGMSLHFEDELAATSNVANWEWYLDGELASEDSDFFTSLDEYGEHEVQLHLISDVGCMNDSTDLFYLYPLPTPIFNFTLPCQNSEMTFVSQSLLAEGFIENINWIIDDIMYSGQSVDINIPDQESIDLQMSVTSNEGCSQTILGSVTIIPAPIVEMLAENFCLGDLTDFSTEIDENDAGGIINFSWDFGDDNSSFLQDPLHFFGSSGFYNTQIEITALNGCRDSDSLSVQIFNHPTVELLVDSICSDMVMPLTQQSDLMGGELDQILWSVESLGDFTGEEIQVNFLSPGSYSAEVEVNTLAGCSGLASANIEVVQFETSAIISSQVIGLPPLEIQFGAIPVNLSLDYTWSSADNGSGLGSSWFHEFTEEGVYQVDLTWTNDLGCYNSTSETIYITEPIADLVVDDLYITESVTGLQISAIIGNEGNLKVQDMALSWNVLGDGLITELWQGELLPGEATLFTFASTAELESIDQVICASARDIAEVTPDLTPWNNSKCNVSTTTSDFELLPIQPNPASDQIHVSVLSESAKAVLVQIYDNVGRICFESAEFTLSEGYSSFDVNVSQLGPGYYTLAVGDAEIRKTQTLMISREQ